MRPAVPRLKRLQGGRRASDDAGDGSASKRGKVGVPARSDALGSGGEEDDKERHSYQGGGAGPYGSLHSGGGDIENVLPTSNGVSRSSSRNQRHRSNPQQPLLPPEPNQEDGCCACVIC